MEFYWVSADEISDLEIYPDNCKKFLLSTMADCGILSIKNRKIFFAQFLHQQ